MRIHRFYIGDDLELAAKVWVNDKNLLHQWCSVLRFKPGQQITLFNNIKEERLYEVDVVESNAVHLKLVTELKPTLPKKDVYLCFSLLKKDKNDWVLQKATEIGVNHLLPIISSRVEKKGLNLDRAKKIVVEASEQCGRTNIPSIREPVGLETAIKELRQNSNLYFADQGGKDLNTIKSNEDKPEVIFIGPEGGWTESETKLLNNSEAIKVGLSDLTLRAETACVVAASQLLTKM